MGTVQKALDFYFNYQTSIIICIVALILGIALVWLFYHLKDENIETHDASKSLKDIEAALKRVLEGTGSVHSTTAIQKSALIEDDDKPAPVVPGAAPAAAKPGTTPAPTTTGASPTASAPGTPAPAAGTPSVATVAAPAAAPAGPNPDVLKLREEVDAKSKKLSEVEKALENARMELANAKTAAPAPAGGAGNTDELQKKLKELEARLGEYEIIEDDIANLSLYKEENTRLKNELEKLKPGGGSGGGGGGSTGGGGAVNAVPDAPVAAEVPTPKAQAAAPIPAAAPAPAAVPAATAAPTTPAAAPASPAPAASGTQVDADKLLNEFNAIVSTSDKDAAPKATEGKDTGEKLIAEFENFMKENGG